MDSSQDKPVRANPNDVTRDVEVNGIDMAELHLQKHKNLHDPIMDVELKINNPIGRLWEAIKRIWKSQKTVINFKFTIPLLVLPIVLFVGYRLWQGRGVNVPMAKVGVIHQISIAGKDKQILILPTSDVYMLSYGPSVKAIPDPDKPVVVSGTYSYLTNTLTVETAAFYNASDEKPSNYTTITPSVITGNELLNNLISGIWTPIANFLNMFK